MNKKNDTIIEVPDDKEESTETTIDVSEEAQEEKKEETQPKYATSEDFEKVQKQLNGLSYLGRKFDDISKKLDSLSTQQNQAPQASPETPPAQEGDKWDALVNKDWKEAVRGLSREQIQEEIKKQQEAQRLAQEQQKRLSTLDESKQFVMNKYPEVNDVTTDIGKRYAEVVKIKPQYLENEFGPILAMRDMEDELRNEGRLDEVSKAAVEKEITRQTRANVTSTPKGTAPSKNSNHIVLTKDEVEFCKHNNISPEKYAKNRKKLEGSGRKQGVNV